MRVRVHRPGPEDRACHFFPGEVCFYEAAFTSGLRLLVHPLVMELLGYFGITPGQLMPNSWRIVINCMEIWLAANEDMIKVSELVHLYRLKESKEYKYYELVPWTRRTRIIKGLASSSGTGNHVSFSCPGTILRSLLARLEVISQDYFVDWEPQT